MTTPIPPLPPAAAPSLPSAARVFYALWPDAAVRGALQAHQRVWAWPGGVSLTRPERLHLTLHFLGEVPTALLAPLADALPRRPEPFELRLTQPALWRGGLAVLLAEEAPAGLLALHARLAQAIRSLDLPVETRPFAPHVTLARRARHAGPPGRPEPVAWTARGAVLVESVRPQGGYRVLAGGG